MNALPCNARTDVRTYEELLSMLVLDLPVRTAHARTGFSLVAVVWRSLRAAAARWS